MIKKGQVILLVLFVCLIMKKYLPNKPYKRPNQLVPAVRPSLSLPQAFRTLSEGPRSDKRNVAGQVISYLEMRDKYGNVVRLKQKQQILNLINGASGNWFVGEGHGANRRPARRKK